MKTTDEVAHERFLKHILMMVQILTFTLALMVLAGVLYV